MDTREAFSKRQNTSVTGKMVSLKKKKNVEVLISSTLGYECTGPLQVQLKWRHTGGEKRWGHIGVGWALNPIWFVYLGKRGRERGGGGETRHMIDVELLIWLK